MANWSISPFSRQTPAARSGEEGDPFLALRREMNRLFDDAFRGFGLPSLAGSTFGRMPDQPKIDVSEAENEVQIVAELPGIDEKDVEVLLADDMLTIRGERKAEQEQRDRNYHVRERTHGVFSRSLPLHFAADPSQVKAAFKDGVLTITIPKPRGEQQRHHRIEIQRDAGAGDRTAAATTTGQPSATAAPSSVESKAKETAE